MGQHHPSPSLWSLLHGSSSLSSSTYPCGGSWSNYYTWIAVSWSPDKFRNQSPFEFRSGRRGAGTCCSSSSCQCSCSDDFTWFGVYLVAAGFIPGTRRSSNRGRAERIISVVCLWTDILWCCRRRNTNIKTCVQISTRSQTRVLRSSHETTGWPVDAATV